jgi:transposase
MEIHCPRCGSDKTVKNGQANGNPKRKCKTCYYQYTKDAMPGAPHNVRLTSVVLYVHGLSINAIARLLNYTPPAVLRWIKYFGRQHLFKPEPISDAVVLEIDEMHHYLKKNPIKSGYGRLIVEIPDSSSTGSLAAVMQLPLRDLNPDLINGR